METLESIKRRIDSAEDLGSIVKTMKALAAVSIRQYERALESVAGYHRTVEMGLKVVLADHDNPQAELRSKSPARTGAIVFGSDHGMSGQFNERIVSYSLKMLDNLGVFPDRRLFLGLGLRLEARLEEAEQTVERRFSVPGSIAGITLVIQQLLLAIDQWREKRQADQVYLFYNRLLSGAAYRPSIVRLLPIDLEKLRQDQKESWPSRSLPTFTMERSQLLSALIRQHLFVLLYRAFAESLASENASRLASMQTAEKNIAERLAELEKQYHDQRQSTITSEILDIISGFEALSGD